MKIFQLTIAFSFFLLCQSFGQTTVPNMQVKTLKGKTVDLKSYVKEGQINILTFWASWCSPCKKELDNIADLYEDWQDDYNVELVAVTIDAAQDLNKAKTIVDAKAWDYVILADTNQELMRKMNFQAIPQTFLVDQKGNIVYAHAGYVDGDEEVLEEEIKKLKK